MDIGLLVIGFILIGIGLIGSFLPVLPGPPIAWCGVLVSFFSAKTTYGLTALIVTFLIMAAVTVLDFLLPPLLTKKTGGTKAGSTGSTVGLIAGILLPLPIIGVIICPFVGALIFEIIHDPNDFDKAFKSACGAFIGFLAGTGVKAIVVCGFLWFLIFNLMDKI